MNETSSIQGNGIERLFIQFAEECDNNPKMNKAVHELRESVFAAAQSDGVNPSNAFGIVFRDMVMLEYFQKRVEEIRTSLESGKLPAFLIEESNQQH